MDSLPTGERLREDKQLLAQYGGPSFLRRARRVEDAWRALTDPLPARRDEFLTMVRLRVGQFLALAGGWDRLAALFPDRDIDAVRHIHQECRPALRAPVERSNSLREIDVAWRDLAESVARFNRRWQRLIKELDLADANRRREEFNRFYLIEKECAVGSYKIARQGYEPLTMLTFADLFARFPLLPTINSPV